MKCFSKCINLLRYLEKKIGVHNLSLLKGIFLSWMHMRLLGYAMEIFKQVKEALGEDDTGTFTYLLKAYADAHNLISEALHKL